MKCDRCRKESFGLTMSFFNTQMICEACEEKDKQDPRYEEARRAEIEAVRRGDFNFPGIGK